MNLRDSVGLGTKLKESIFNNNNQINSIVTTRTWVLSTEWTKYRIWILLKKRWWSSFVWMVDVVLQSARVLYDINKADGDKPLPLLPFRRFVVNAIFLKYSKEARVSSIQVGIQNIPWDICYDDTKHQV